MDIYTYVNWLINICGFIAHSKNHDHLNIFLSFYDILIMLLFCLRLFSHQEQNPYPQKQGPLCWFLCLIFQLIFPDVSKINLYENKMKLLKFSDIYHACLLLHQPFFNLSEISPIHMLLPYSSKLSSDLAILRRPLSFLVQPHLSPSRICYLSCHRVIWYVQRD